MNRRGHCGGDETRTGYTRTRQDKARRSRLFGGGEVKGGRQPDESDLVCGVEFLVICYGVADGVLHCEFN